MEFAQQKILCNNILCAKPVTCLCHSNSKPQNPLSSWFFSWAKDSFVVVTQVSALNLNRKNVQTYTFWMVSLPYWECSVQSESTVLQVDMTQTKHLVFCLAVLSVNEMQQTLWTLLHFMLWCCKDIFGKASKLKLEWFRLRKKIGLFQNKCLSMGHMFPQVILWEIDCVKSLSVFLQILMEVFTL